MENKSAEMPADLSGMLSSIMSNPQAMSMLTSLLGNMSGEKHKEVCEEECKAEVSVPAPCEAKGKNEKRRQLLLALKPFLSPERRQALDRILMISEALSLLQKERRD